MSRDKRDHGALSDEHNTRGIELADRGWLDEAIEEFRKAIQLDPTSAHAHDNLATVLSEKQLHREALAEYLRAIELEPESAAAHYNLACFLSAHGQELAAAEFREAIGLDPRSADAHLNLGLTLADQGEPAEAARELEAAVALGPKDAFPRQELAALHMEAGDFRAAIAQLKEVVRLEPEGFESHLDLGICFARKGFFVEAERAYARAEALSADDLLLHYNRAALYALWRKPQQALEGLRRAVALDAGKVREWLRADPMFDALRGTPEFEAWRSGRPGS